MNQWVGVLVVGLTVLALRPAQADLQLCNKEAASVGIAIGYQDAAHRWTTEGWWTLPPHGCATVLKGALPARSYYVYAIDHDNGGEWAGATFLCTHDKQFKIRGSEDCVARGYRRSGFFKIDTGPIVEKKVQPPKDAMCICTAQYDPVCGRAANGRMTTYSNACRAGCDNARIVRKGAC